MCRSLKIGIDIDGVMADQTREILRRINAETNSRFRRRHVDAWDAKLGGIDIEVAIEKALAEDDTYIRGMRVLPTARVSLAKLSQKHTLIAVTHRSEGAREATQDWISQKGLPISRIEYTRGSSKAEVDVDILVDDNPANVDEFAKSSGTAILLRQPWNREVKNQTAKVRIAANWDEVCNIVDEIAGQETG